MNPEGWKLVPVEPTQAMVEAAFDALPNSPLEGRIRTHYRAMLDAAPTPPAATLRLPEPMTKAELRAIRMKARASPEAETTNWLALACRAVEAEVIRRVKEANNG